MEVLWRPSQDFIHHSNLKKYEHFLAANYQLSFASYQQLWEWSTTYTDLFWESIWHFFDILHDGTIHHITEGSSMPGTRWFTGTKLNYAEHLFRHQNPDRPGLIFANEHKETQQISWLEIENKVTALHEYLKSIGVGQGDRVVAYLPNIPQTVMAFMAVNSLGAIWSCCSMDFGWKTVVDRFSQIEAKVIIAADGYYYKNKDFDRAPELKKIISNLPLLEQVILISNINQNKQFDEYQNWDEITLDRFPGVLEFQRVPFDHPIWILYSSGTTGKPKAITHSHGGMLLEHLKYLSFHNDVKPGENFFWFTTTGWMMWNFLQASMLVGGIPVLYEGSPSFPDLGVLWELSEQLPIHHFGTSAPYLTALMNADLALGKQYDLSSLRSIGSTGAPLPAAAFEYIYEKISEEVWLCSMSGGTDVCTAFVGGIPYRPVIKGHIQGRGLGCALFSYDENGQSIRETLGEMVIEKPMPCMPIYFWNDPDYARYQQAYFEEYPGKWRHGDFIKIFSDGSLIIRGRSDATLNRKGIRIGTAEIYDVINAIAEIEDALILNLEKEDGNDVMPLFVVMSNQSTLDEDLQQKIRTTLRNNCSPRHVPDTIVEVPDIPYTLSGKKMEVPVKRLFMTPAENQNVNLEAVKNPDAMEFFIHNATALRKIIWEQSS